MESQMDHKQPPPQHQVFINFRGDQLRNNFISHLVKALKGCGINVFIDTYEQKGKDIKNLFKRIEESRIVLAIFSTRYTESTWCLDELVKTKERLDLGMVEVLPIFYKVSTESVKQLVGEFGDHFRRREWEYRYEQPKIDGWKKALECVTGKLGFTLDEKSSESNFIEAIVEEVLRMLSNIPLHAHTSSNPQQIQQLPGNGGTSSPVTLTEHAKAHKEVKLIPTQPDRNISPWPIYVTNPRDNDSSLPLGHTKVSRNGSTILVRQRQLGTREQIVNHAKGSRPDETVDIVTRVKEIMAGPSRPETVDIVTRVKEIMAGPPRLGRETTYLARSSRPKTMYKRVLSFLGFKGF